MADSLLLFMCLERPQVYIQVTFRPHCKLYLGLLVLKYDIISLLKHAINDNGYMMLVRFTFKIAYNLTEK